jgi:peptide/nickel transport system permease protein
MSDDISGDDKPATDDDVSVFEVKSDVEWTRREKYSLLLKTWFVEPGRVILRDPRGVVGLLLTGMFILMGTIGVMLIQAPEPVGTIYVQPFQNWSHPLGTQNRGMDMLALIVHSTPNMLRMILAGSVFATLAASVVGIVAGYKGGVIDSVLSSLADIALAIPGLPLIIVLSFVIQPTNPYLVGLLVAVNAWGGLARSIRSQVLTIRNEAFVEKSRALGLNDRTIFAKDILPGLLPYISVGFVNQSRLVIFNSVGLYFLGVLPFSHLNWGMMINLAFGAGAMFSPRMFHWLYVPIVTVILMSLGFMLLAQSLDRVFNPRTRARASGETTSLNE